VFRVRLMFLGLLAVFAVSAIASASASAHGFWRCKEVAAGTGKYENHECIKEGGNKNWERKALGVGETEGVSGTSGVSKLESKILGKNITIECKKDTFTGTLEEGGKSRGEVKFKECKVVGLAGCEVKEPIEFKFKDLLVGPEPGVEDEFKGEEAEEVFVTIEIKICAIKGKYKVKGTQICKLPEAETWKIIHKIECTPAGSKLKLGENEAKFTSTEEVETTTKWGWDAT
jgi:hypothetical protein